MADQQYDVSQKLRRLFEEKQKIREKFRYEFLKANGSPYSGADLMHDSAVIKYHAALSYRVEHYKINAKTSSKFFASVALPVLLTFYFLQTSKTEEERKIRSGEIAYKDRTFRGIL